jgi:amino acid permease
MPICHFVFETSEVTGVSQERELNPTKARQKASIRKLFWRFPISGSFLLLLFLYKSHKQDKRGATKHAPYTLGIPEYSPVARHTACEHGRDDVGYVFALVEP